MVQYLILYLYNLVLQNYLQSTRPVVIKGLPAAIVVSVVNKLEDGVQYTETSTLSKNT